MGVLKKWLWAFVLASLAGCEKRIDFDLNETADKLVVEASIENGEGPRVVLTNSFNYFSTINLQLLQSAFVRGAAVYISNGSKTHRLKEYEVPLAMGYSLYYYATDSSDMATAIVGEEEGTYALKIVKEGQEYTAQTTIPKMTKGLDSMWWKPVPLSEDSNRVTLMVRATDPPGYGDYMRYYTRINDAPFFPGSNSVYDDLFVDGTTYDIPVEPGVDRNANREEEDGFFKKGDTVTLKLSNIDRATYDFWRTMEYSYQTIGNPFSSPIKVLGNISNGALGYFGGYASQYHTLVIPK